jgi:hypothetical protein
MSRIRGKAMNPIWGASHARGVHLAKWGCSLPFLDALPAREGAERCKLHVWPLGGYIESYAIDWGANTAYLVALRIGTELSRTVIHDFRLVPPWPDHKIDWDYDLEGIVPKGTFRTHERLVRSRLRSVLIDGRLLYRGVPVEGLLCGRAWAPIPESWTRDTPATAEIVLVDDAGTEVRAPIKLRLYRVKRQNGQMRKTTAAQDWEGSHGSR